MTSGIDTDNCEGMKEKETKGIQPVASSTPGEHVPGLWSLPYKHYSLILPVSFAHARNISSLGKWLFHADLQPIH